MIEDIKSGMEVPAASIVSHIIAFGMLSISATCTADSTIKCESAAISTILTTNVRQKLFFDIFTFGMIISKIFDVNLVIGFFCTSSSTSFTGSSLIS